ncbi:MAG: D-tyrosyl-tRNA(Tyr) deacylase [Clostridia bacterium]|nr:D-tyrosyl-tRNA(Tyr) deacylase [Clostridia bacterium]
MTAVIQRITNAQLRIDDNIYSEIGKGLLILLGISVDDTETDLNILATKCDGLRIFEDSEGKMNLSVNDIGGEIMVVSNFTLCADTKKGKRPSFINAARPEAAKPLYEAFINILCKKTPVKTGVFGADMKINLINDGPVTIIINSKDLI